MFNFVGVFSGQYMSRFVLVVLLLGFLSGCFNIRTKYFETKYYSLQQEEFSFRNIATVDASIFLVELKVPSLLDGNSMFQILKDGSVKKYFYHRWISEYEEMISDFIISRINLSKAFSEPVRKDVSLLVDSDYFLSGQVIDFSAYSDDSKNNYVNVAIQFSLIKKVGAVRQIIFLKNYTQRINRQSSAVETIPPAFSKALSLIVDSLILDIQGVIAEEK